MSGPTPPAPPVASATDRAAGRYDIALDCVHCGLCLPTCPTYLHLGDEADSPRGRIYLMRAHDEGRQAVTLEFAAHLDRCLVCRACETACPSGVRFGSMMEEFRALARPEVDRLVEAAGPTYAARFRTAFGRLVLLHVLPHRRRLRMLVEALRLYQRGPAPALLGRLGVLRALGLEAQAAMAPPVPAIGRRGTWPEVLSPLGRRRARVLFLAGCVAPELLPDMVRASLAVLRHNGCEVVTPRRQTCCGALHFHLGERERGLELLARNLAAFGLGGVDAVVTNAAGCGSTLKEYGELALGTPVAPAAAAFAARVRDIAEFLEALGPVEPTVAVTARVAYDEPCHLLHGQRVSEAPQSLLRRIPGVEMVPLADADRCCGSAGVYNVLHPDLATAILDEKIRQVALCGADVVATGNPGCILQIRSGLRRASRTDPRLAAVRVLHPVELLARGYGEPASAPAAAPARAGW
jgi:glycolate oxidase iron-sulfur subunit